MLYEIFFFCSGSYSDNVTNLFELNGQGYFISEHQEMINWDEAWTDCKSFNAKLAKIDSVELQLKLETELPKHGYYCYWTAGYSDQTKEKIFIWNSGKAFNTI